MRIVLYAVSTLHASELLETAKRLGWEVAAAVRNLPRVPAPPDLERVVEAELLDSRLLELPFAVPQTNPGQRYAATRAALERGFQRAVTMVDPSASLASSTELGEGCYVGAGSTLGAGARLGEGCLINRSCSLAHHTVLGEYVGTGPGAVIAGCCRVEAGAFIGTGAVLTPEVHVGKGAVIGAGAVVLRDVAPAEVVVGNPARVLKRAEAVPVVPWQ